MHTGKQKVSYHLIYVNSEDLDHLCIQVIQSVIVIKVNGNVSKVNCEGLFNLYFCIV